MTKGDYRILLGQRASSITHYLPVLSSETRRILVKPSSKKCDNPQMGLSFTSAALSGIYNSDS